VPEPPVACALVRASDTVTADAADA
jgi:hypothetical protein